MIHKCNSKYFLCFQKHENSNLKILCLSGSGCSVCLNTNVNEMIEQVSFCPFCGYTIVNKENKGIKENEDAN